MTIGQRIAQKRKELGISQEVLGDQLGVSRQSIYKWESDSTLPEIDKLISLGRLFDVSVGWLLGVEDPPNPAGEAGGPEGELTETQLNMVEEIVGRYIASQPAPRKHRRWPWAAAGLALCLAGVFLFQRLDQADQQYRELQNSIRQVETSVDRQIDSISSRVEEILKSQDSLTADSGTELRHISLSGGDITGIAVFSAYAVPKTYQDGMTAEFSIENGTGGVQVVPGLLHPDRKTFYADSISSTLTDSISLSVTFISPDGTRQTQLLEHYGGLYSGSMPAVSLHEYGQLLGAAADSSGLIALPELYVSTVPDPPGLYQSQAKTVRVGLFKNQGLVTWLELWDPPDNLQEDFAEETFYRLPTNTKVTMTWSTDQLCFAAVVTDAYGREAVYSGAPYILHDGELTWPAASDISDHDPANWRYTAS